MNVILFGPPGVGKSTLIGYLKTAGHRALDLEDVYPNRIRFQLANVLTDCFIGGADLDPKRNYPGAKKVLLIMDQLAYETRRKLRDVLVPEKANQTDHLMSDWLKGASYDALVDVTNLQDALRAILKLKGDKR